MMLRRQGKAEEALDVFSLAYALRPSGRAMAQLGLVELSLRNYPDAEMHLAGALDRDDSEWVDKNRGALQRYLAEIRRNLAKLVINAPPGAAIYGDGRNLGRAPLAPLFRTPGPLRLQAKLEGFEPKEITVLLAQGRDTEADLTLVPLSSREPAPPPAAPPLVPMTDRSSSSWRTWSGGTALALALAGVAAGAVWLAVDGKGSCDPAPGGVCQNLYDTRRQGWIAIGSGAALGAAGLALLLWRDEGTSLSLAPSGVAGTW